MRIEYESHQFLPGGFLLLWVTEWREPTFGEQLLGRLRRNRLARARGGDRRCYAFDRETGRWLDDAKRVVLSTDPRHIRLLELVVAQRIEQAVDQVVGL